MIRKSALLLMLTLLASGCGLYKPYTNISVIKGNPQKYQGREVLVRGTVVETLSFPLIQKGLFQIDDGTDRIWVASQERIPSRGDRVTVKGKVKIGFTVLNRTFGIAIAEGEEQEK